MEKKQRFVHIMARSNFGALVRLTLSEDTDDIRGLISVALKKLSSFNSETEFFNIEHIDSVSHLHDTRFTE